jgi:hypothetical protein
MDEDDVLQEEGEDADARKYLAFRLPRSPLVSRDAAVTIGAGAVSRTR